MKKVYNDILNLGLNQGIEDSKNYLDILYLELKIYKRQLDFLNNKKTFCFQKKKIKKCESEKELLEIKIKKKQQDILKELELIKKMIEN